VIENRSMPRSSVIPTLAYANVTEASRWLCDAFGFKERLRIGTHRIQLVLGDGAVVVTALTAGADRGAADASKAATHSLLVRVEDADRHHEQARRSGARILQAPTDFPYGERQYTAEDLGGHRWTFSQSIADVDPASWGGTAVNID
jgi:uncharacterized glyoxalase superfamily protein PhnB